MRNHSVPQFPRLVRRFDAAPPRLWRAGFTLVEMLVGITLFAALSAVVIPAAVVQIQKGQVTADMSELEAIRLGIGSFEADVRRFPYEVNQLVHEPGTNGVGGSPTGVNGAVDLQFTHDNGVSNKSIPSGLEKRWNGPYLKLGYIADGMDTSLGGKIERTFAYKCVNGSRYLAIAVSGISQEDAIDLSIQKDKESDLNAGLIQWTTAGADTLFYLAAAVGSPGC